MNIQQNLKLLERIYANVDGYLLTKSIKRRLKEAKAYEKLENSKFVNLQHLASVNIKKLHMERYTLKVSLNSWWTL